MSSERLTEKKVAQAVLPKISEARELLAAHLSGLQYLRTKVDKNQKDSMSVETYYLHVALEKLESLEDDLCQI